MALTKVKGKDIEESTIFSVNLASDNTSLEKVSGGLMYSSGINIGIGELSPRGILHVTQDAVAGAHYDTRSFMKFENEEGGIQVISTDQGNDASAILLTNAPESGTGDNKHWIIHHRGKTSGNRLDIGYKTSSSSGTISTGAHDGITILPNGHFGIGIINPDSRLEVYQSIAGEATLLTLTKHESDINNSSKINMDFKFLDDNDNGVPQARIQAWANTDQSLGTGQMAEGTADLLFFTANAVSNTENNLAERMRITSIGRVGIANNSPSVRLDIGANSSENEIIRVRSGSGFAGLELRGDTQDSSSESGGAYISMYQDGNVISSIMGLVQSNDGDGAGGSFSGTTTNSFLVANRSNNALHLGTNNTVRMTIMGNGNVGINTASPADILHVTGYVRSTSGYRVGSNTVIDSSRNATFAKMVADNIKGTTLTITSGTKEVTWAHSYGSTNYVVAVTPSSPARHIYYESKTANSVKFFIDYAHDENIQFDVILYGW